mmetsp:Transcript_9682/g.24309  ORF Transcript_9682/g.24309 Transcript_9682/m.24309 type:complete len:145 (-) Transcript_9682:134-568(-)
MSAFVVSFTPARPASAFTATRARPAARAAAAPLRRAVLRASAGTEDEETTVPLATMTEDEMETKKMVLQALADEAQMPRYTETSRLGATRDADGKSNVWAVEPKVVEDQNEEGKGGGVVIGVIAMAITAVLILVQVGFTNPEQL